MNEEEVEILNIEKGQSVQEAIAVAKEMEKLRNIKKEKQKRQEIISSLREKTDPSEIKTSSNPENNVEYLELEFKRLEAAMIRIRARLNTFEESNKKLINHTLDETSKEVISRFEQISKNTLTQAFENTSYANLLREDIFIKMTNEIETRLSKTGMNDFLDSKIKEILKVHAKEHIEQVIQEVMVGLNKKLKFEYEYAKKLAYSIDSTIKHVVRDANISLDMEDRIIKLIHNEFNKIRSEEIKMIEKKIEI